MTEGSTTLKITTLDIVIKNAALGVAYNPTRQRVNRLSVVAAMVVAPERWLQYLIGQKKNLTSQFIFIRVVYHNLGN
jgi:hypothetical protein